MWKPIFLPRFLFTCNFFSSQHQMRWSPCYCSLVPSFLVTRLDFAVEGLLTTQKFSPIQILPCSLEIWESEITLIRHCDSINSFVSIPFQLDEGLCKVNPFYLIRRENGGCIDGVKVCLVEPGTFQKFREFLLKVTPTAVNQLKIPRKLTSKEQLLFFVKNLAIDGA